MTSRRAFVYCHGLPGSDRELDSLGNAANLVVLDRTSRWREYPDWECRLLAGFDALEIRTGNDRVRLAGFSLGAMAALHLAARRPEAIASVDLVSPAGPLELGDFLPLMAGRFVFAAARAGSLPLALLTRLQQGMVTLSPDLMVRALFASSSASERSLLADPQFADAIRHALRQCLLSHRPAYQSELRAYVRPWADVLGKVRCPVRIWHGDEDNWVPRAMAEALADRLGSLATLETASAAGHFGTLRRILPVIAAASGGDVLPPGGKETG